MRLFAIGLAAAALAVLSPAMASAADQKKDDPKAHAQGMKEVPPLIDQTGVNCTPTDAKFMGEGKSKDPATGKDVTEKVYEVACQEGLGYVLLAPMGEAPSAFDCFAMSANKPKQGEADKGQLFCRLPGNADPLQGLTTVATKAGVSCTITDARYMGGDTVKKFDQYELACSSGHALVMQYPLKGSSQPMGAYDCMTLQSGLCHFFGKDKLAATLTQMAAPSNRTCQVTDGRYIGTDTKTRQDIYEVACTDPAAGFILTIDAAGKYVTSIDCARAEAISGGCTLSAAGQTAELGTYAKLAKEIGYPCAVSSYRSIGTDPTGREVVEFACSDHADGAIALLPTDKGQTGAFFNCARAEIVGKDQKCALTPAAATNAKLASEISAKGHSCNVTNSRWVGITTTGADYVEVACQGQPGMMLEYAQGPEQLKGITSCLQAKGIGDGCQLK